jgi:hypothetical protein
MCTLQIQMQCYDKFFEVLPDDVENAELIVENVIGHILLDLFGGGTVDDVTICFSSRLRMGLRHCSVQIRAQCPGQGIIAFPRPESLPYKNENMQLAIEKSICSVMKELFVSVKVDSVLLKPSPWDYGGDPALSRIT